MDGQLLSLIVLLGVISSGHRWTSGSALEVTVRRGDNVTLYCDCKYSTGVFIVWFRNCSHENQPPLVLRVKRKTVVDSTNPLPRFHFLRNESSTSYDLLILNVSDSDEGLYYCGTESVTVVDEERITQKHVYTYGNVTRILFNSVDSSDHNVPVLSWTTMVTPAVVVLFTNVSLIVIYHLSRKTDTPGIHQKRRESRRQTGGMRDEDLCLTQVVFRPEDRKTQESNLSLRNYTAAGND